MISSQIPSDLKLVFRVRPKVLSHNISIVLAQNVAFRSVANSVPVN